MSDPPKRPGLIWVITVGYALVFALMAWVGGFLFSHWETLPETLGAAKTARRSTSPLEAM
jgi:hypothetical protein